MINARYKLNISLASRDFKTFYKGRFLCVKTKKNEFNYSRIGVLVSRKNSIFATKRNWLKRFVYGFFQENKRFLDENSPSLDFLIMFLTTTSEIKDNKEAFVQELNNVISI